MIAYQVYGNDGKGGPVDYTTILATVTGTNYLPPTLAAGGDYRYAVRAVDQSTGTVETNTTAVVRVMLDPNGVDLGSLPPAPVILDCYRIGSMIRIDWIWTATRSRIASGFQFLNGSTVVTQVPGGPSGRFGANVVPPPGVTTLSVVTTIGGIISPPVVVNLPLASLASLPVDGLTGSATGRPGM